MVACFHLRGGEAAGRLNGGGHKWARWAVVRAQDGYTALIFAAMHGRADCVRLLLDAGADKDAKNEVRARGSACEALGVGYDADGLMR